eukprot:c25030_g12_i1 orf=2-646(+)
MYGKCGSLEDACEMFNKMPQRDLVSWNALIDAYVQHDRGREAFQLFRELEMHGFTPDIITFVTILNACQRGVSLAEGRLIHARIVERGFETHVVLGTALVNMYGKWGNVDDARRIFDKMHERNIVSWNTMIAAYSQHGCSKEVLQLFLQMQLEGVVANRITFVSMLNTCSSPADLAEGMVIHGRIVERRLESHVVVGNAIINMYGKCGSLEDAR